ncbi:MAG TPA: ABC transporter permease [Terriglobia bacterium]|nr:ABC transporter permease [Terriglobia bacterium]
MSLWRQITRGTRALAHRAAADQDVNDEVAHYIEQATAELVARGLSPADARRRVRLDLGSATAVHEQVRSSGWENGVEVLLADLRYAGRRLLSNPGFTAVCALTLALGIGASAAIFSAINPVLFEPLPYPHANRIVMIWDIFQGERSDVTFQTYRELEKRSHSFSRIAAYEGWQPTMTGAAEPERLDGQSVSWQYFRALGVVPALGRDFIESDDAFHGPNVAILSDALWRRRFGGTRAIVGRSVTLDGDSYTIIGVMPRGFEDVPAASTGIWSAMQYDPGHIEDQKSTEWGHHLRLLGRLEAGVSLDGARRDLNAIARAPVPEFPRPRWAALDNGLVVDSLQADVTRGVRPALLAILGAVLLLLAIACVNVTSLLLARGAQRQGEFAMRAALGASRSRLIRQVLTESLLLSFAGGALGILVAVNGVRALVALSPPGLPRVDAITVNGPVLAFAFLVTTLIGLAVGLFPAVHVSRDDLRAGLQGNARQTAGSHQVTRRALVVAEVSLAIVLLVSAGLLLHSLNRLFRVDPGFDPSHMLTMQVQTSGHKFDDLASAPGVGPSLRRQFFSQALDSVRRVPGVSAAAFTSLLPFTSPELSIYGTHFEKNQGGFDVFRYVVSPGYFETMRIPLLRGRLLDEHDLEGSAPVTVISASLARHEFGSENPIGQHVHIGPTDRPWFTIVGVVADVKQVSLADNQLDEVYITPAQSWFADDVMALVVRARGEAAALTPAVRKAIWSVDRDEPIVEVSTMDRLVAETAAERRFALILFEAFGLVALVLAATGIYGVLSGSVNERMREIGVRSALGATRGNILGLVIGQGMTLTAIGILIGLGVAVLASQALVTLLFGISRLDAATYAGVIGLLGCVAGIACWLPAWRAARVDPAITLRAE